MDKAKAIENVVRAKVLLEGKQPKRMRHSDRCMIDLDPDYYGPCTCGADNANARVDGQYTDVFKALDAALAALTS